jgi:tetratricopeptide (TPR) repeat protein
VGLLDTMSYHFDRAEANLTQAIVQAETVGAQTDAMIAAWGLAYLEYSRGDLVASQRRYEHVLKMTEELKDILGHARVLADIGYVLLRQREFEKALQVSQESTEMCEKYELTDGPGYAWNLLGYAWLALTREGEAEKLAKAAAAFEHAIQDWKKELRPQLMIEPLAGLALTRQRCGEAQAAQAHVETILEFLKTGDLDGLMEPVSVYLACWEVLDAAGDPRARQILAAGSDFLQVRAERQANPAIRQSLLENIPAHVQLMRLAQEHLSAA